MTPDDQHILQLIELIRKKWCAAYLDISWTICRLIQHAYLLLPPGRHLTTGRTGSQEKSPAPHRQLVVREDEVEFIDGYGWIIIG